MEVLPSGRLWHGLAGAHYNAISPNGKYLLDSSTMQPDAYLVDAHRGKKLATFKIGKIVQGANFSPDSRCGAVVSAADGAVSIIDVGTRRVIHTVAVGKAPHARPRPALTR